MPTSTAYRLLAELEQHGLVQRGAGRTVALGTRLVALGRAAEAGLRERLVEPARAVMEQLSARLGETGDPDRAVRARGDRAARRRGREHSVRLSYAVFRRGADAPRRLGQDPRRLPGARRARAAAGRGRVGAPRARAGPDPPRRLRRTRSASSTRARPALAAPILDRRGRLAAGLSIAGPAERLAATSSDTSRSVIAAAQTIERAQQR